MSGSLLTPRRRQIKRSIQRDIDAMVEAWKQRTGSSSVNTHIGPAPCGGTSRLMSSRSEAVVD